MSNKTCHLVTMHKQIVIAIMVTKKISSYSPVSIHAGIIEMTCEMSFLTLTYHNIIYCLFNK